MNASSRHTAARPAPARGRGAGSAAANDQAAEADRLVSLLTPVVTAMGMDLEGVRIISAGRRRLLRVVVDADGGVSLDDIALVSRELSAELDAAGAMGEAPYTLEVSSPGVDRPLTEPRHWRRAVGRLVAVSVTSAPAGAVEGRITTVSVHGVTLETGGERREFGYAELGPGRIILEFGRLSDLPDTDGADPGEGAAEDEPDGH